MTVGSLLLGVLIISVTCLVAWINGDTSGLTKGDGADWRYMVPLILGAWLCFAPLRRQMFGGSRPRDD